ncbi:MAG: TIM barrel protein [Candidatus Latescibacteria bacterium]|nr:TIM barrel protein [Candidatus Latescibacterota bacterium]
MHVGTQQFNTSDEDLEYLARHGVFHKNENFIDFNHDDGWDVDDLAAKKEKAARFGVEIEMVAIPIAQLAPDGVTVPTYMRETSAQGDAEIELVCKMVRQAADVGIPAIKYYLCEMENQRTESVPLGRGNSRYSTWDLEKADDSPRYDQPVTAEMNWARITHFLERVIPVATECKVRMACHPCDPWLPPGFKGVDRVLGGPDGFKKFIEICPSPYHGVNLCLGCMAEASLDPRNDVPEIIRYFGSRKKIHLIHFRNIVGGRNKFQEVWPDEGVMSMYRNMKALKEVGYPHMCVPDHAPGHPNSDRYQAWAYEFGYIQAMIQAVMEGE